MVIVYIILTRWNVKHCAFQDPKLDFRIDLRKEIYAASVKVEDGFHRP